MESVSLKEEVIMATFVNVHLFWIIPKRSLLLRSTITKILHLQQNKNILDYDRLMENDMVAVTVDGTWTRAIIKQVINRDLRENVKIICWLPDYGIMREVLNVFVMPEELHKCPPLALQASLHNVVNLTTELTLGVHGYNFELKKTTNHINGISKIAVENFEGAEKIYFSTIGEDECNIYGDIILDNGNDRQQSLTDFLIEKNLINRDATMFKSMECDRRLLKDFYFGFSGSWLKPLDKTETKNLSNIIFNRELNKTPPIMEFFKRKPFNDRFRN